MATMNEKFQSAMANAGEGLKTAVMIGNNFLVGGLYGVLLLASPWKLPVQIMAGLSSWAIGGVLTKKTDEYIDSIIKDINANVTGLPENIENNLNNIVDIGK